MSNAILVGPSRSASGHSIFVAGPQVGYFFPEVLLEYDLHGGGIDVRGIARAGAAVRRDRPRQGLRLERDHRPARDIVDTFVEIALRARRRALPLQGPVPGDDDLRRGRPSGRAGAGATRRSRSTRPSTGRSPATRRVKGVRVALAQERSTRGREAVNLVPFMELNENVPTSPQGIRQDDEQARARVQLALRGQRAHRVRSRARGCRCARRAPTRNCRCLGNGEYDWRGFAPPAAAPAGDRPARGLHRQLEQPAGARLRRLGRQLVVRVGAPRPAPLRRVRAAAEAHARAGGLDHEQGGDAGSARRRGVAGDPGRADDRSRRRAPARRRWSTCSRRGRRPARAASTGTSTARSTIPGAAIMDAVWPRVAEAVMSAGARPAHRAASPR